MSEASCLTAVTLAEICGGRLMDPAGQSETVIRRVATVDEAGPDAVTWISSRKHAKALEACRAAAVIGTQALLGGDPRGILVDDPELAVAKVLDCFWIPPERPARGVHPNASVHETAPLGAHVRTR